MSLAETLSFWPYGQYALYIWLSYGITFILILGLFVRASINYKKIRSQLKNKYAREND